nr:potassium channel subfamily T member 2-like isoform X7 [Biomphalaria glabrata]
MTEQALIYDFRQLYTCVVRPDALFLDTLAHFPLVYYMTGSIWSVDDLLVARITQDSYLVVVKRNPDSNYEGEEFLEDSSTIVAIQKIVRLFPSVTVLTELTQVSYIKFMDISGLTLASKNLRHKSTSGSHLGEIFCLPFAAGHFFSSSMFWTFVKLKKATVRKYQMYGHLYEDFCRQVGKYHLLSTEPSQWTTLRYMLQVLLDIKLTTTLKHRSEGYSMMGSQCHHQASI